MVQYFPFLKWKSGEQVALDNLNVTDERLFPVIQLIDHVNPQSFFNSLLKKFSGQVYLDTSACSDEDENKTFLQSLIQYARENNINAYPIINYDEINIIKPYEKCAITIPIPLDFDGPSLPDIINSIVDFTTTHNIETDLFLNSGLILNQNQANIIFTEYKSCLNLLNNQTKLSKYIICLTSFPENLSNIPKGQIVLKNRFDIKIFNLLSNYNKSSQLKRTLHFSDYGVTKYTDSDIDFSKIKNGILPKIKYTTANHYIILKGSNKPLINSTNLSGILVNSDHYYGKDFSYGDNQIYLKSQGNGVGNNANWVTYCCNHHITTVLSELSTMI